MELIAKFGLYNGSLLLLLILGYVLRRSVNTIFLGLSFFFVWYALFVDWLNITGLILHYPIFERTGSIAAYLACPFLFIYSRNTFYPGRLWRKTDWILLVPALAYVIYFMPFFLLPAEQKNEIWRLNLGNLKKMLLLRDGWFGSSGFYFGFIYIWIFIIMYFQFRLIAQNRKVKNGFRSIHNRRLLYFVAMISVLYLPLFVPGIFGVLFQLSWFNDRFIAFSFGLTLSAIAIYLLVYPNILYGFIPEVRFSKRSLTESYQLIARQHDIVVEQETKPPVLEITGREEDSSGPIISTEEEIQAELSIVLEVMEKERPFRQQGFTIQSLSNLTGIPVYQLSPLINNSFKMNFTSWINRYRVEYFLEHARDNRHMTLEALAKEAGFTSRSTFIHAFKKEKGTTPREYLKDLKMR
jgi:AraC-like DNA-binding protein